MMNLPDNVTGNELAIAGADWHDTTLEICPNTECNFEGWCESWGYGKSVTSTCPACNQKWTREDCEE